MQAPASSLHSAVDKWLAPTATRPARVAQLCRSHITGMRYVRVEAWHGGELIGIIFFRHDDGTWNVFPPQARRPSMNAARLAA
ncbi:conserved hypothetical protein [Burkholderia sp. 8Y]|uniref:hypothetical protein n=1 Tax=Burkholderia sp. 8Y TaxID=2653133 RepID=UPI0012F25F3A|nr:hypothetical protein [Burkholderia sp. 8Y]VXC74740.1 conserved hypothetical protein [Burkholderia sp. 8Y]